MFSLDDIIITDLNENRLKYNDLLSKSSEFIIELESFRRYILGFVFKLYVNIKDNMKPVLILYTSYPDLGFFGQYEYFNSLDAFGGYETFDDFLSNVVSKANTSYNKDVVSYLSSVAWQDNKLRPIFNDFSYILDKTNASSNIIYQRKLVHIINPFDIDFKPIYNDTICLVASIIESSQTGFSISSSFKTRLAKHNMLKPDSYITIDLNALFIDKVLKFKSGR